MFVSRSILFVNWLFVAAQQRDYLFVASRPRNSSQTWNQARIIQMHAQLLVDSVLRV